MIAILVGKELRAHARTLRLTVALLLTVVLCVLAALLGSAEYSRNVRAYRAAVNERSEEMAQATVYSRLMPNVLVPPQPVQVLARGRVGGAGQGFGVHPQSYYLGAYTIDGTQYDDLLHTLVQVDFAAVVALLLGFLAVVLGFDAICGERELGTLRLVLANPVSRGQVLAAKLIGGALALWVPLALAFVASLLVLQANPDIAFSGDDWVRLALVFLVSCLFLAVVFSLSVLISAWVRRSATALIVCLFGWLVLGTGYGNALPATVRYSLDWPPWQEFVDQRQAEWERHEAAMDEWVRHNPAPPPAYLVGLQNEGVRRYVHPRGIAWLERRAQHEFERTLETADRVCRHRWANQEVLARQQFLVDRWAVLSPFTGYQTVCRWLARSTLDDNFAVARYGIRYREAYVAYLRGRFAAQGWRRSLPESLARALPGVLALLVMLAGSVALAAWRFSRYEVA
ncbi:MAG: ABC transporter permease subunit [Candidatus Latescibacterota bacterium]